MDETVDDALDEHHTVRGFLSLLYLAQRDHEAALEAARRTIEVHPDYADGYATLAFVSSYSGRYEEALAAIDQARRINPQSTGIFLGIEGRIYFLMERYRDALRVLEAAVERNPGFDRIHLHLAAVHAELGNLDAAAWSVEEALAISPDISLAKERREALYQDRRDLERYLGALRKAGVAE